MNNSISKIIKNIKSLRIQGATNVAKAALDAFKIRVSSSKARSKRALYYSLFELSHMLSKTRPTEPMMRNEIHNIMVIAYKLVKAKKSLEEMKERLLSEIKKEFQDISLSREKILTYGSNLIFKNSKIMTICHSSTVVDIIKHAHKNKKNPYVISLETRPLYQGRITAMELSGYGVDVLSVVDNAAGTYIKDCDLVMVGADAITSCGDLINKIGTSTLALLANTFGVPFYSATALKKFDLSTFYGNVEKIEKRSPKEVWNIKQDNLRVQNYAFDKTSHKYIKGYITEVGIVPPEMFVYFANKKLRSGNYEKKF